MKLFPHNLEAYERVSRFFETHKRVCVIHPTGTGKSLIIANFIDQHLSRRHLVLAPGPHIFNEIKKHLSKGNVTFSTYIGLKMNEPIFVPDSFDYIYLDEFHRLGADVWGGAAERLIKNNPNAKILGTSATHIRYLDDSRNMASEIFDNCIASQMSLNMAIANGILPAPTYVSALYSLQDEVGRMRKRILLSNRKNKETLIRDLDSRVIDWERSSGLDSIIEKHVNVRRNRVIVFCKDWEHVAYAKRMLDPIFEKIYGSTESLSLYAKKSDSENNSDLRLFAGEEAHAVVLYTIDKVNEGLHSKNCNTVILLRDTISPIVFYQQIGRAFSVKAKDRPLIIDLVNNFNNIQLVSFKKDFEDELKFVKGNDAGSVGGKEKTAIEFIDETQDIRQIFSFFEDKIDVWKMFYERARAYFENYGHLFVGQADPELREWLRIQRKAALAGKMGKDRETRLRSIGMEFEKELTQQWMTYVGDLEEWRRRTTNLPKIDEDGRLYAWMVRQRQAFRAGTLSARQVEILQGLMSLADDTRVKDRIERLVGHFKNGNGAVTDEAIREDLNRVKTLRRLNRIPTDLLDMLSAANVPLDVTLNDHRWFERLKKVLAYVDENGEAPKYTLPLYNFCIKERRYLKRKHPSSAFIERNAEVALLYERFKNIIARMKKPDWDSQYEMLRRIVKEHGHVSSQTCELHLQEWMWRQRRFIRDGKLAPEKVRKLREIKEIDWRSNTSTRLG